jgi:hypothetical protein
MREADEPASLSLIAEEAGLGLADVAQVAGLDESTISRLWADPRWLDRVTGASLQRMIASVPGVAEYVTGYSMAARLAGLAGELAQAGLDVDGDGVRSAQDAGVPAPHLANALQAALHTVRGDIPRATAQLARLWGRDQDQALARVFSSGPGQVLANPGRLIEASAELAPRLRRPGYSLNSILAGAALAHHAHVAPPPAQVTRVSDRQGALSLRSSVMGTLITGNDFDAAQRYEAMVAKYPVLGVVEEWSFPTYTRDARPDPAFSLSRSLLLRNTASEVIREIDGYSDAYVHYLLSVYVPLAVSRDPTFGLAMKRLKAAISARLARGGDPRLRELCEGTLRKLEGVTYE